MSFLLDASSTLELIRSLDESTALRVLSESYVLDLGKYEVGNALWKEHTLRRSITEDEFREFLRLLTGAILHSKTLTVDAQNLPDVAKLAAKERMTFYDASYVQIAASRSLTLVTEDARLGKTASKYAKATTARHLKANSH
jgi:predicted nucleic acid-binding protein